MNKISTAAVKEELHVAKIHEDAIITSATQRAKVMGEVVGVTGPAPLDPNLTDTVLNSKYCEHVNYELTLLKSCMKPENCENIAYMKSTALAASIRNIREHQKKSKKLNDILHGNETLDIIISKSLQEKTIGLVSIEIPTAVNVIHKFKTSNERLTHMKWVCEHYLRHGIKANNELSNIALYSFLIHTYIFTEKFESVKNLYKSLKWNIDINNFARHLQKLRVKKENPFWKLKDMEEIITSIEDALLAL